MAPSGEAVFCWCSRILFSVSIRRNNGVCYPYVHQSCRQIFQFGGVTGNTCSTWHRLKILRQVESVPKFDFSTPKHLLVYRLVISDMTVEGPVGKIELSGHDVRFF